MVTLEDLQKKSMEAEIERTKALTEEIKANIEVKKAQVENLMQDLKNKKNVR